MNEQEEIKIKNQLIKFIRENFEFEGEQNAVQDKLFNTVEKLYLLVQHIRGIEPEKDSGHGEVIHS